MALGTDNFTSADLDVMFPKRIGERKWTLIDLEAETPTRGKQRYA